MSPCGTCGGTGAIDTGGFNPDMTPISMPCPHCQCLCDEDERCKFCDPRIQQREDAELGRKWREDSGLEKWFPLTAEQVKSMETMLNRATKAIDELRDKNAELQQIISAITNRSPQVEALRWLMDGKYRSIQHRHDGSYRLHNSALNIWADVDSLENAAKSEWWPKFRDCTERAP